MKTLKIFFLTILIALITNCTMKIKTDINKEEYIEIDSIANNGSFQIDEIISREFEVDYTFFDIFNNCIVTDSYLEFENKNEFICNKISLSGDVIDTCNINNILKEGTMWTNEYYQNWIINGDKTKHKYLDPLSDEEKRKPKKWIAKFEEMYKKASVVYESSWSYYMKIEGLWYKFEQNLKVNSEEFEKQYPIKYSEVRMIELENICPSFSVPPEKRDSSLLVERKYVSEQFEKSERGSGFNFSAGWWYLDLYLPNGDTLKIKRYASFKNPDLKIYRIPKEYGGRKEVLFIVQKPDEMLKEQVGGMYVIRPKETIKK